jgi:hypothetical protein
MSHSIMPVELSTKIVPETYGCSFVDLDTPLLLSEDPVYGSYEGILTQNSLFFFALFCDYITYSTMIITICLQNNTQL